MGVGGLAAHNCVTDPGNRARCRLLSCVSDESQAGWHAECYPDYSCCWSDPAHCLSVCGSVLGGLLPQKVHLAFRGFLLLAMVMSPFVMADLAMSCNRAQNKQIHDFRFIAFFFSFVYIELLRDGLLLKVNDAVPRSNR